MKKLTLAFLLITSIAIAQRSPGDRFAIAIEKGDLEEVQAIVNEGASPDTLIEYGEHKITPLMKACWEGYPDIITYLIDAGADVNATDENGETPLINAVHRNRAEVARMLIERGAKVNVRDSREFTPIAMAASSGDLEMVTLLAEKKADLTAESYGLTPLSFAASAGNVEMIQLLVKLGAPVNYASKGGDAGSTALMNAVYAGKLEAVQALIDLKANVNIKTKSGDTPMKAAQKGDQADMIALLQKAGAKGAAATAAPSNASKKPAVQAEAEPNTPGSAKDPASAEQARKALAEQGVDLNNLERALWDAIDQGNAGQARLLVDAGADVNQKGAYGESMTLRLASSGNLEVLDILIGAGADVNAENEYHMAPLAVASERGNKEVVEALLRAGANVNARNTYGGTALQVAVLRGYTEIVKILISAGADVARDRKDLLDLAKRENHPEIEQLIREAPAKKK